mmetsp:Transcript_58973/g.129466  ORF Transcript_58973/g.129466 Transcript_58973/m.129466 type:complete len:92 (-) Transcript_58973:3-278(-)
MRFQVLHSTPPSLPPSSTGNVTRCDLNLSLPSHSLFTLACMFHLLRMAHAPQEVLPLALGNLARASRYHYLIIIIIIMTYPSGPSAASLAS